MRLNMLAGFDTLQVFLGKAEMKLLKGNNKTDDNRVLQHTKVYFDFSHLDCKLGKRYFYFLVLTYFVLLHLLAVKKTENVFEINI